MKKYEKLIEDTTAKIDAFKKGNKGHTAASTQTKLNLLQKAISKGDEKAAEEAAGNLSELKTIEVKPEAFAPVEVVGKKKK